VEVAISDEHDFVWSSAHDPVRPRTGEGLRTQLVQWRTGWNGSGEDEREFEQELRIGSSQMEDDSSETIVDDDAGLQVAARCSAPGCADNVGEEGRDRGRESVEPLKGAAYVAGLELSTVGVADSRDDWKLGVIRPACR
jgi:hypothetical protein